MGLRFTKMHGAGNDFVVLDRRAAVGPLDAALAARLGDRRRGIGCDQILSIEPARSPAAAFAYGIWNQDGSAARQCGNGARCVAAWAHRAGLVSGDRFVIDSPAGPVAVQRFADDDLEVELPAADFRPESVPFLGPEQAEVVVDGRNWRFAVVSLGNPHALIEVDAVEQVDVATIGRALQRDPRFPQSCNVGFATVVDAGRIRLRVFERGVGETLACGSGACAAFALLQRRGALAGSAAVELPGGTLQLSSAGPGAPIRMRGPAAFVFEGELLS